MPGQTTKRAAVAPASEKHTACRQRMIRGKRLPRFFASKGAARSIVFALFSRTVSCRKRAADNFCRFAQKEDGRNRSRRAAASCIAPQARNKERPAALQEERRPTAGTRFLKTAACAALLERAVRSTALLAACGSPRTGAWQHIGTPRTKSRVKAYGAFINKEARFSEGSEKSALRDSFVLLLFAECSSLCIVHRSRLNTRKTEATASSTLISVTTGPAMAATPSGGKIRASRGAASGVNANKPVSSTAENAEARCRR